MKTTDKEKLKQCPILTLNGWWWKKYFNYFQKRNKALNDNFRIDWLNGGYEAFEKMTEGIYNKIMLEAHPPLTINSKSEKIDKEILTII